MSHSTRNLEHMLAELDAYLIRENLSQKTIQQYRTTFRALKKFAIKQQKKDYSDDFGNAFLRCKFNVSRYAKGYYPTRIANAIRVVWMLNSLSKDKKIKTIYHHNQPSIFPPDFQKIFNEYKEEYFYHSKSLHTWVRIHDLIVKFLKFIITKKVTSFSDLRPKHIEAYFCGISGLSKMALATERQRLKKFLLFLVNHQYVQSNLIDFLPHIILYRKSKAPSIWNEKEIKELLLSIDRNSAIGKRDYAMLLLAIQMGLRSSDILNLKLTNLTWSQNPQECAIDFVQTKTGKQFSQPMPYDVATALVDYLKNARPESADPHIFLRHGSHIGKLQGATGRIYNLLERANIKITNRKHGFHSLRHTFATRLVSNGTPLKVVSELMGHTSVISTGTYITVDLKTLRNCALKPMELKNERK